MSFKAKIVLDSINPHNGVRLVTSELTYPRFIHAEFMTHRVFSRNAASSRAIPNSKMIKHVTETPAIPIYWGKSKRGMSANQELESQEDAEKIWLAAKDEMIARACQFRDMKLHKQIANRILEPWKYITVICSATQYSNFFALRDHGDAQPEIQYLARLWKHALDESIPVERQWHIPYIQDDEQDLNLEIKKKVGAARCARVSYLTHDGVRNIEKDLALHERLLTGSGHGHWSPFEHVAEATDLKGTYYNFATKEFEESPIRCGNFHGWIQYRKTCFGECQ
jgi:thymidylate synthase ThyX